MDQVRDRGSVNNAPTSPAEERCRHYSCLAAHAAELAAMGDTMRAVELHRELHRDAHDGGTVRCRFEVRP
jgi:hypothetical protein